MANETDTAARLIDSVRRKEPGACAVYADWLLERASSPPSDDVILRVALLRAAHDGRSMSDTLASLVLWARTMENDSTKGSIVPLGITLGLSTAHAVEPGGIAAITAFSTGPAYRLARFIVADESAPYFAIHDLRIDRQSQFLTTQPIRASFFSTANRDFLQFGTVQSGSDITAIVENLDDQPRNFHATILGALSRHADPSEPGEPRNSSPSPSVAPIADR